MDQPCSVKYQSKYVDQKNYLHQSIFLFHVRLWQLFGHNMMLFNPELETIAFRKLHPNPEFREIPSSYGNFTMGIGEATRFWSGWFERLFGSNTLLSRKLKHQTFQNWSIWQTKLIRIPFTSPELQLKIKRVGLILLAYRREKIIREKNTLKHCCCRVLLGFQGDIRNIQKHFKRTWILWILESLLLFERNYLFQSLRLAPHLFTLISIPDFVVTFGLNQHPLPADFFLFQDIAAAQHRKECRQKRFVKS